jgi:hypothetical protein
MIRAIGNFAEFMDQTKMRWQSISWEKCPHHTKLKHQAKFVFGLHGSVLANIMSCHWRVLCTEMACNGLISIWTRICFCSAVKSGGPIEDVAP